MKLFRKQLALLCAFSLITISCLFAGHVEAQSSTTETFESGTKTSYAAADVFLTTGWWFLNDALIGNLSTDRDTSRKHFLRRLSIINQLQLVQGCVEYA